MSFYLWKSAIPIDECERLIEDAGVGEVTKAIVGDGGLDEAVRKTDVAWVDEKRTINRVLESYINEANRLFFKYDLHGTEKMQFAKYDVGGFYGWHIDAMGLDSKIDNTRKLTCILQLSDPLSYRGGEFQMFRGIRKPESPDIKERGSIIVFNSSEFHQITPVIEGVRYSLVVWATGPNLK